MPLGNVRFGVRTTKSGKRIRLAFRGNKVVEAKNIDSGAMHTPAEFAKDYKKKSKKNKVKGILRKALNKLRGKQ